MGTTFLNHNVNLLLWKALLSNLTMFQVWVDEVVFSLMQTGLEGK